MEGKNFIKSENENFHNKLIKSNIAGDFTGNDKFYEIKGNPNKIVRLESFENLEQRYFNQIDASNLVEVGKKLFTELENKYAISVPVEFFIDKNEKGDDVVYAQVDRIDGVNLEKVEPTKEATEEIIKLYNSISIYYLDKSQKEENHLADINNASQYMYGKKNGDKEPRIYLTDTDLYINSGKVSLLHNIKWFLRHMGWVERKFNTKFEDARENIKKLIENISIPDNLTDTEKSNANREIREINEISIGDFSNLDKDEEGFISSSIL